MALAQRRRDPDRAEADLLPNDKHDLLLCTCLATMPNWALISGTQEVEPLMPRWSAGQRREALATLRCFAEREIVSDLGTVFLGAR